MAEFVHKDDDRKHKQKCERMKGECRGLIKNHFKHLFLLVAPHRFDNGIRANWRSI
jgi:hypothetical protein